MGKKVWNSFLFGGCVGILGQAFIMAASLVIPDPMPATLLAMLVVGLISAVVIRTGFYDRIAGFAGFGADQPLCGLMFGAAQISRGEKAGGKSAGPAAAAGFVKVMIIVAIGFLISAGLGFVLG